LRDADASVDHSVDCQAVKRLLADAVREGGALALKKFRSPFKTWTKLHDSPVSEVDIAVNELLQERLGAFSPDYGWLSEESVDDAARLTARQLWIVDPIDGTRAFIAGREDWVISAALAQNGRPLVGAVYVPVADQLFLGCAGEGATRNGQVITARAGDELDGARVAGPKRHIDTLGAAGIQVEAEPRVHSLALRLVRVAEGSLDIAFAGGNSRDWDIAAADVIIHQAGGKLTDLDGSPVAYNRPDPVHGGLVAASRARHAQTIRLMADRHTASA
jgi:myo-inositol-1(or 4)-monophosphatase